MTIRIEKCEFPWIVTITYDRPLRWNLRVPHLWASTNTGDQTISVTTINSSVKHEMKKWLEENIGENNFERGDSGLIMRIDIFRFRNEGDAILFKLAYEGKV